MKKLQAVFVGVFLALLFVPVIFFNWRGTVSVRENRMLAPFPKNFREADDYIADRFGLRDTFVNIAANVFGTSSERAIRGKDGWLFYEYTEDFLKTNASPELAERFARSLKGVSDWCAENGIAFIAVVVPVKHSVYEEFYPIPRPEGKTAMDYCAEAMEGSGVNFVWPRDLLIASKKDFDFPLYYKTDLHWNPAGARVAANVLIKMIEDTFPDVNFPKPEYEIEATLDMDAHGGLLDTLGTNRKFSDYDVQVHGNFSDYCDVVGYTGENVVEGSITRGKDPSLPSALIYHDSMFNTVERFISPMFSRSENHYCMDVRRFDDIKEYLLNYRPDILIFEWGENAALERVPDLNS